MNAEKPTPCTSIAVPPNRELEAKFGETVMPLEYVNALARMVVPPAVVTIRGTGVELGACGGVTAWNVPEVMSVTASGSPPRVAVSSGVVGVVAGGSGKLAPLTVIVVPPWAGPAGGHTLKSDVLRPIENTPVEAVCATSPPLELFVV